MSAQLEPSTKEGAKPGDLFIALGEMMNQQEDNEKKQQEIFRQQHQMGPADKVTKDEMDVAFLNHLGYIPKYEPEGKSWDQNRPVFWFAGPIAFLSWKTSQEIWDSMNNCRPSSYYIDDKFLYFNDFQEDKMTCLKKCNNKKTGECPF
jgi:hypothetical protein